MPVLTMRHDDPTEQIPAYVPAEGEATTRIQVRRPFVRWIWRALTATIVLAILGAGGVLAIFGVLSSELPNIRSLADYRPKQATVVYGAKGEIVARFASERRTVVPYERIPKVMIDAVLAAEDEAFFEHGGIDYLGILRCAVKSALRGRAVCGGSTITQQMVKTFLLSSEKKLTRKVKEAILTKRVEDSLSKQDILYLYLNQIYFGHGAHGVQEAARVYFSKDIEQIGVEEAALLAGLPQQPSRLDPYKFPERARRRRAYVLGQMRDLKTIDEATYTRALASPLAVDYSRDEEVDSNNWYVAHIKTLLDERLGEEATMDGGYKVFTGLVPSWQARAERAVEDGLAELDKRQGWRGPLARVDKDVLNELERRLATRLSTVAPSLGAADPTAPLIWDLSKIEEIKPDALDRAVRAARFRRLSTTQSFGGLVVRVDDARKTATVRLAPEVDVTLPLKGGLDWARKFNIASMTRRPRAPSEVLSVGDVVLVRATAVKLDQGRLAITGALEQRPKVQAALVAIEPHSRAVRTLVGGYGIGAGKFNRATQARRQAGSTFKPLLYASALETGEYTTITHCQDAPRVYRDPWTGEAWKPKNYENRFDGEISIRTALTLSKNLCSVELIDKIGVDRAIDTARRAGIDSPLVRSLTIGLGAGDVTPLEMVNSYATLAAAGEYAPPLFIEKIVDADERVVFEAKLTLEPRISAAVAYQITSLMQSVVEDGTAQRVKKLARPVAGKTGTTNEARNAWFIGYTPDLAVGVWVGFDDNEPLGPGETGGRAAIPIWLDFMEHAMAGAEVRDFVAPSNIVFAFVDPKTGRLAAPDAPGAAYEPFVAGTEPTEFATDAKPPTNFGMDDFER